MMNKSLLKCNGCKCYKTTKCITNKCECFVKNGKCSNECSCSMSKCLNRDKNDDDKTGNDTLVLNEVPRLTDLIKQLRVTVTKKKPSIIDYRNGIDLYTGASSLTLENPHVDHIIEGQIIGRAMFNTLNNNSHNCTYLESVKQAINIIENYNVTSRLINTSKGNVVKEFFYNNPQKYPLRVIILGKKCEKYMNRICNAMIDSHEYVDYHLRYSRRDGFVTKNENDFNKIADELSKILLDKMELVVKDERVLRSKNVYLNEF